ncbi:MAG: hypothetical protein ACKO1M_14795 [Planctomycetota bacterium]
MHPTVYLETTIIGYLAIQPSGVLRIAANQQTTHEWWTGHRHRFSVYVSRFVVSECAAGDSVAAALLGEVPRPSARSSQNQALDQTADKVQR